MDIRIIICLLVFILFYLVYRMFFYKRFNWIRFGTEGERNEIQYILYTDKLKSGIQKEIVTDFKLNHHNVNYHLRSKNNFYRKQWFQGFFKKVEE